MMPDSTPSVNSWVEDELYQQYLYDRGTVDPAWKEVFESDGHATSNGGTHAATNGAAATPPASHVVTASPTAPAVQPQAGEQLVPLRGPALRIAENMTASLSIPVATSQRVMPVKVMEENRKAINQYLASEPRASGAGKLSYTYLTAWAMVKAL